MKFDFTPHIHLSKKQANIYTVSRLFVYATFTIFSIVLLQRILFPTAYFTFDFSKPNALANTIAPPYERNDDLIFDAAAIGTFDRARIEITTNTITVQPLTLTAQRGYVASFYPTAPHDITRDTHDALTGRLFTRHNGIWIITDHQTIAPIADAATLLAKGWSFDAITPIDTAKITSYKKRKLFTLKDTHPNGTLLRITKNDIFDHYERIFDHTRSILSSKEVDTYYTLHDQITIRTESHDTTIPCTLTASKLPWRSHTYTCTISLTDLHDLIGTDYHFTLSDTQKTDIDTLNISLHRSITKQNIQSSLGLLKQRFLRHYTN